MKLVWKRILVQIVFLLTREAGNYCLKIIDKINQHIKEKRPFFSFEFFPPKTDAGVYNLYSRLERMAKLEPAFIDFTWGAGGSTSGLSLELSRVAQQYFCVDVMMHLTCTEMPVSKIEETLQECRDAGIQNILALRGDPPQGDSDWRPCEGGLNYGSDLVKFIREKHGDYFGISVGGYPEGHEESKDKDECVQFLKHKVSQGADFVVTQLFYDVEEFFVFEKRCREAGVTVPILPGILPIQNYNSFKKFSDFLKIKVPEKVSSELEEIKNDDEAVQKYGIKLCEEMCREMLKRGVPGLHFYTLNLEKAVTAVLKNIGLIDDSVSSRVLPWRPATMNGRRAEEEVRPIFWSNRPKSYLARTMSWDNFPNGRWGLSSSPAFGRWSDHYLSRQVVGSNARRERLKKALGEPQTLSDISQVFVDFCEAKIDQLPWCEFPVQAETTKINSELKSINSQGYLTINSQPQVNGVDSTDPDVGWGGPGGYIYQKAYAEFFTSRANLDRLLSRVDSFPSMTFRAVNVEGKIFTNDKKRNGSVNAVTWGVFPGKEIIQPTVVDSESFMIWKEEAFKLWLGEWASFYPKESVANNLIQEIHDTFYLVNVVENNYIDGDLFRLFFD